MNRRLVLAPALLVLVFMLFPVVVIVGISLGTSPLYQFPPTALSAKWFMALFANTRFMAAMFQVSVPLAVGAALTSTVVGTLAAIGLLRTRLPGRQVIEGLFIAPLIFPQILLGVGLYLLYTKLDVSPSLLTLGLGHVVICTPYVVRAVLAGLSDVNPAIEEAAQNLGASPVRAFVLTILPLLRSSIVSGGLFAFIVSFSDVNLALFLTQAGTTTLPMQILSQMQYTSDPMIAAAAAMQVAVVAVMLTVTQFIVGAARL